MFSDSLTRQQQLAKAVLAISESDRLSEQDRAEWEELNQLVEPFLTIANQNLGEVSPRTGGSRFLILCNPRSGSSLLSSYLHCHPHINVHDELLNADTQNLPTEPLSILQQLDDELSTCYPGTVECFKVHVSQLVATNIDPLEFIRRLNLAFVVVVWRRSLLDSFVSLKIAEATNCWYSETSDSKVYQIHVAEDEFNRFCDETREHWRNMIERIGNHVNFILIEYSSLNQYPDSSVAPVFRACGLQNVPVETAMKKQNPVDPAAKISNWLSLSRTAVNEELHIDVMLDEVRECHRLQSQPWWPEPEPSPNDGVWIYRVAEPYVAPEALTNVFKAVATRSISSASLPITEMACELRRMFNVPVAQPCANGFVSLLLAMQAAGIGPGDCVLVPSFTMIAVPNAVLYVGGTPVFVDNAYTKYNPGVKEYETAAHRCAEGKHRVKAIVTAHTYSVPADIQQLQAMCLQNEWILIEDISECIGVSVGGKLLGTFGIYACASLYANKTITAGDGGFVLSRDPTVAARLISIVNHGFTPRYHFVHLEPCIDGKMNGLAAALVTAAVRRTYEVIEHRARMSSWYRKGLRSANTHGIVCMPEAGDADGPWVFGIECSSRLERDQLRNFLAREHGIETRNYFPPLNIQPAFDKLPEFTRVACPETLRLAEIGFYLPSHYWLQETDVRNICKSILSFFSHEKWTLPERCFLGPPASAMLNPKTGLFNVFGGSDIQDRQVIVNAASIMMRLHAFFTTDRENWSTSKELESMLLETGAETSLDIDLRSTLRFFGTYLSDMRAHNHILPVLSSRSPWHNFHLLKTDVRTSTAAEVQQLVCWLAVEHECRTIVELGPWLGGTTTQLLHALREFEGVHLTAVDGFRWQQWMNNRSDPWQTQAVGRPFLSNFISNVKAVASETCTVLPVQLSYDTGTWMKTLKGIFTRPIDLIFFDLSDDDDELELLWQALEHQLVPYKTVIVFQTYGYARGVCEFVARHFSYLKPLHKPAAFAKAFLYIGLPVVQNHEFQSVRKVRFAEPPSDWNHHRAGGFCAITNYAREQLHDERSKILFIPAVEQYFFEHDLSIDVPWMGIMHQVPDCDTVWVPDVNRLLHSPSFISSLTRCRGIYTLSTYLSNYIRERLPFSEIPVCRLFYPISAPIEALPINEDQFRTKVVMIGGYMRNIDDFFMLEVPPNMEKVLLLTEIEGVEEQRLAQQAKTKNVKVLSRLSDIDYETLLRSSIPFLSLKSDGVASTLLIECIFSHTPILLRRFASLEEYLGRQYPLFFDSLDEAAGRLCEINIRNAVFHLVNMHKSHLSREHFVKSISRSAPYVGLPSTTTARQVDLTICICSYQRTDDLPRILRALLYEQDFEGTYEIILWNNNFDRRGEVERICSFFDKPIHLIHSSDNYYCIIRLCMLHLMHSDWLLTIDDDMFPGPSLLSTFMEQKNLYGSRCILCLHGHKFLPHTLDMENPSNGWASDETVRFVDDRDCPDFIHFAHADGCLFPRQALRDASTIPMAYEEFVLVDDYWLSYVLCNYFAYRLCKIPWQADMYTKTSSADDASVALYLNPKVKNARIQLYIYHMLRGWPKFPSIDLALVRRELTSLSSALRTIKTSAWQHPFVGFNIPMELQVKDMQALQQFGVKVVRLGAVCSALDDSSDENIISDLIFLLPQCMGKIGHASLQRLVSYIDLLGKHDINVILTLHRNIASPNVWQQIAAVLTSVPNIIGYDLINEPYTLSEQKMCKEDLNACNDASVQDLLSYYGTILDAIRREDTNTPVIIESSFWCNWRALRLLNVATPLLECHTRDPDMFKVSFHMYEPRELTTQRFNKGRYTYPGIIPDADWKYAATHEWNSAHINIVFRNIRQVVTQVLGLSPKQVFVGEIGISRDIPGAELYLRDILRACHEQGWSSCLYAFREYHWDVMDYELGQDENNGRNRSSTNPLMRTIIQAIENMHSS